MLPRRSAAGGDREAIVSDSNTHDKNSIEQYAINPLGVSPNAAMEFRMPAPMHRRPFTLFVLTFAVHILATSLVLAVEPFAIRNPEHLKQPQWTTGSRLLHLGESIAFRFFVPEGTEGGKLDIFERYLELGKPGAAFRVGEEPSWISALAPTTVPLKFETGRASVSFKPPRTGNYLARWTVAGERLYRYFSVVDSNSIVLRYGGYYELEMRPMFEACGVPIDLPLPIKHFEPGDARGELYLEMHRRYGYAVTPRLDDTPDDTQDERVRRYGEDLKRARSFLIDENDAREARIEMWHPQDPGYVPTLRRLGVESHFGLQMANGGVWLGMPEFAYLASDSNSRRPKQGPGGLFCHQWDFTGGWHFLGPLSWHFSMSGNDFETAKKCLHDGLAEFQNMATQNPQPAFLFPLYDGNIRSSEAMR